MSALNTRDRCHERNPGPMIESREDATRLARQIVERDAKITALIEDRPCDTGVLQQLWAENAASARILADWVLDQTLPLSPLMRPQIRLTLVRPDSPPDSPPSSVQIGGGRVTRAMLEAAEDLLHTLATGERQLPKDLYEVVARAFGTTRDDSKGRILLAIYGGRGAPLTPPLEEPPT